MSSIRPCRARRASPESTTTSARFKVLAQSCPGGPTDDPQAVFNGNNAGAGNIVKVYDDGALIGSTTADGSGSWVFKPASAVSNGRHNMTFTTTKPITGAVSPSSNAWALRRRYDDPPIAPRRRPPSHGLWDQLRFEARKPISLIGAPALSGRSMRTTHDHGHRSPRRNDHSIASKTTKQATHDATMGIGGSRKQWHLEHAAGEHDSLRRRFLASTW